MHGQQNIKIAIIILFFPLRLVNGSFKMNLDKNVLFVLLLLLCMLHALTIVHLTNHSCARCQV